MHSCNMDSVLYIHSISAPCYNKTLNCTLLFHSTNCTTVRSTYPTWLPRCQIRTQCNSKQPSRPPANPLQFQGSCKPFKSTFKSKQSHIFASKFLKQHPIFKTASKTSFFISINCIQNFNRHPKILTCIQNVRSIQIQFK